MKKIIAIIVCSILFITVFASCSKEVQYESYYPEPTTKPELPIAKDVNGGNLVFAENNQTKYSIVIPEQANAYENWGATDLRNILLDSTGADFRIMSDKNLDYNNSKYYISVGFTKFFDSVKSSKGVDLTQSKYGKTGGVIFQDGNSLFLVGNGGYGTLNSIYEFLSRQIDFEAYSTDELYYNSYTKLNMYEYGVQDVIYKTEFRIPEFGKIISSANFGPASRMGIMSAGNGGTMLDGTIYATYLHTLEYILPSNDGWWNNGQPCLSNTEVIEYVAEASKEYILREPSAKYIMYGGRDNAGICNCPNCSKIALESSGGGLMLNFCNKVAEKLEPWLKEQGREIIFLGLMYLGYETAPSTYDAVSDKWTAISGYKARKDVGVYLCFPNGDYGHGLDDATSTTNVGEYRKLKAWASVTDNIGVYLYDSNYNNYMMYCNAVSAYTGWARGLQNYNVDLVYHDVIYNNTYSPFSDLKMYLISKLDKDATAFSQTELTKNFCKHYYKDASAEMYKLYDDIRMHFTAISIEAGTQSINCYDTYPQYSNKQYWPINAFDGFLETVKKAYDKLEKSILDDKTKELVKIRILAEEFYLRYLKYSLHSDYFSASEAKAEEEWLVATSKILGIARTGETSGGVAF